MSRESSERGSQGPNDTEVYGNIFEFYSKYEK